jgi:hypothetical protein
MDRPPDQAPEPESSAATLTLLVDACCFIVLFATGRIVEIVADLPFRLAVVDLARSEAQFIRRGGDGDAAADLVPVDWHPLVDSDLVAVLSLSGEDEQLAFIDLLARLDDGEAATLSVAERRGFAVATDDWAARTLFTSRAPHLPLYSSLDLLHRWSQRRGLDASEIGQLLKDVRERARFLPPRDDPLSPWWHQHFPRG